MKEIDIPGIVKNMVLEARLSPNVARGRRLMGEIEQCLDFFDPTDLRKHKKKVVIHSNRITIGFLGENKYFYEESIVDLDKGEFYKERVEMDKKSVRRVRKNHSGVTFLSDQNISKDAFNHMSGKIRKITFPYEEYLRNKA